MKSRDLEILKLTAVIHVTLVIKSLHFDHPISYNDKIRPYKQFSIPFFYSSEWRRAGQLLKQTTPKFGDLTQ